MGPAQPLQLQPVLGTAEEGVGGGHLSTVGPSDVTAADQRPQSHQCAGQPQVDVRAAVHQLEELNREFDVAQASAAEFELLALELFGDVLLDPPTHGLHVVDE